MDKDGLLAFTDAVIAVIITIMVLELKVPQSSQWSALRDVLSTFMCYVLSFIYVGIYWNNHHHLFQAVKQANGHVILVNSHMLFWLSLVLVTTAWMGENHFATIPTAAYGIVLVLSAVAYTILLTTLLYSQGPHSLLATALGRDFKAEVSLVIYVVAVAAAFLNDYVARALYGLMALMRLMPDPRIEKTVSTSYD